MTQHETLMQILLFFALVAEGGVTRLLYSGVLKMQKKHGKVFRFTMTTNGVLLTDEIADFLNREMNNVVLSLDGRPEVNDAMRPNAGGKGSYAGIVPKYQRFVAKRGDKDYYVRGTFTKENLDFTEDVLHMASLGFDQISVEPVVSDPSLPFSIR